MSTSTGPGRPVRAMWKASWMASGISSGSWIMIECLTIGMVMPVTSASWKPSVPSRSVRTWPVMKTVGTLSMIASAIGRDQVGGAGAGGGERHPDPARGLRVALGGVAGALLVTALDVAHARVVERVVGGQVGAARDPEYVLDALGLEALHDGVDCSHAAPSGSGWTDRRWYQRFFTARGSPDRARSGRRPGRGWPRRCRIRGTAGAESARSLRYSSAARVPMNGRAEADQEPEEERAALDLPDRARGQAEEEEDEQELHRARSAPGRQRTRRAQIDRDHREHDDEDPGDGGHEAQHELEQQPGGDQQDDYGQQLASRRWTRAHPCPEG